MKKILIILLACFMISCGNNKNEKAYSPDELEYFDGYVLIGETYNKSMSELYFILKDPITEKQYPLQVSRRTFDEHNIGDTIRYIAQVNEELELSMPTPDEDDEMFETVVKEYMQNGHEFVITISHSENCPCKSTNE